MKKWLIILLIAFGLAALAISARWWLPPTLAFIGANSDLIQGLTDAAQLVLWLAAGIVALMPALFGLRPWQGQRAVQPSTTSTVEARDQATVAQDGGVAAGQIAVGRDVQGDIIVVADPAHLWPRISRKPPSTDLSQAIQRYLEHVVDRYRYLDFRGMGVSDRVPLRLPLVEMYIPLKARIEMPEGETWARELRLAGRQMSQEEADMIGHRLSEPQPVLDLLREQGGLIVLGDPGAGKTTFLKYLTLRLATGEGEALGVGSRLPILIPLSAYANALAEVDVPLDRFIGDYYHNLGSQLPIARMLAEALERGGALLLMDGLDEVKDMAQRRVVVDRVVDFFTFHRRQGNKFILSSRIVGYREVRPTAEGLAECTLVDFEQADIVDFISKWTTALERAARGSTPVAVQEAAREKEELLSAVERNPGVAALAANPLLLTILALMKRQGVILPERRVELYQKYIETLLKTWNLARGLGRPASRDLDVVETMRLLAPLALWMHQTSPGVGLVKREPLRRKLIEICEGRALENPEGAAGQLLDDVREHAGLLLERGPGEYGFIHLTFQEYLAAVAIALRGQRDVDEVVGILAGHVGDDNWHEVTLLTVGYMGIIQQLDVVAGQVVRDLIKRSPGEPGQAVVLAGEAVLDAWPGGVDPATRQMVGGILVKTLAADYAVKPALRAAAGDALAQLGDPRPGVGLRADGLPDIAWCEAPAGPFLMGSDPAKDRNATNDEQPQHEVTLPAYAISRYPVTNAQYEAFVADGGYTGEWRHCWTDAGWDWKGERVEPEKYGGVYDLPNHPVVMVSWYEAVAFCNWLTEILRLDENSSSSAVHRIAPNQIIRLPSEREWEKAARGTDGRTFPWGEEITPQHANYAQTGIGATSAAGCFPAGQSLYGCEEMAGNVWEWCQTKWQDSYEDYKDDNDNEGNARRVLRGGAFFNYADNVRCAIRYDWDPNLRFRNLGFRLVLSPFTSGL